MFILASHHFKCYASQRIQDGVCLNESPRESQIYNQEKCLVICEQSVLIEISIILFDLFLSCCLIDIVNVIVVCFCPTSPAWVWSKSPDTESGNWRGFTKHR